ncbi:Kynurenine formamidase [Orchesella cincta]|uniref:Kynurenine formamidase n=1 Tax=Orchesella cincta TaxID=48709 RepID=A0A1D2MUC4_ORCCI|nr:Kynurenine formamidase [Orchesella cincta]
MTSEEAESWSPLLQPTLDSKDFGKNLQILIWVGAIDSPEFQRQSKEYAEKLRPKFKNVELQIFDEDDHFTIVERLCETSESSPGDCLKTALESKIKV